MSSSLLAGGHMVSLTPCEESRMALHPTPSPGLPALCPYYTTESWGTQPLMAPTLRKGSSDRLQQAQQAEARAHCLLQGPGEQASGASQDLESCIDFSLEALNQMILEIDPTFQLLPSGTAGPQAESTNSIMSRNKKEEPEALDIKYIEVTSTRSRYLDGPQRCSSPCATPPFGSPRSGSLFLSRDIPRETRSSSNESLIFSGNQGRGPSPLTPSSLSNAIPCRESRTSGSPLATPPGWEKGLRAPQRGSRVSILSASPVSDVSYVFGSNQSLPHSSLSSYPSSSRSLGSPASSSSSLHSLDRGSQCGRPSDAQAPSNPILGMGQPQAVQSTPVAKEQASSCPASVTNSMADIPIVLINGSPEPQSPPAQRTPGHQDSVQSRVTSPSHLCQAIKSPSKTLPDVPLPASPDGPAKDMQPTMKFVMDTSKYWFKPSITREQAINLLRTEKPGAFVIRDSSSYRGSFGLALKVQETSASAPNRPGEDSSDLIRHFLIESSAKGVHLKGADEEPYFGSLSSFVCQHSIMALALPCKLTIPQKELGGAEPASDSPTHGQTSCLKISAGCHTLYLSSVSVETLSGALAVQKAISVTLERDVLPTPTVVHFKVTEQGITLTDVQRKVFFRRHYPLSALRFCGMDPEQRKWQKYCKPSRIFGFVAKSQTEPQENVCHLFAEYDAVQPASQVISLVTALLQDTERM
ncbi:tensin-4 precursor [Mus musculus]|uniref:Tensin-4 n=2 Tax=cellular organisms TaxID=131567 RepID=TENS4_MOUSE|nr:tensin-4 precursor [Mus musculus]Q8BZ33.2 RecName: Full=Tensin-4; Flags: Precursor [Mus musculus]EDL16179.1 tensin 4 [Mus musculus]|eukprot:NP_766152.2 tensin-4 precursor [Mus musculus]